MKIQNKITLLFTLLTGLIILFFSMFIYLFANRNVHESFFHRLEVRAEIAANSGLLQDTQKTEIYNEVKTKYLKYLPAESHKEYTGSKEAEFIQKTKTLGVPEEFISTAIKKGKSRYLSTDTFYVATFIRHTNGNILQISTAIDESGFEEMASLKKTILIGICISLIIVFTLGKLFASSVFKPVREIISKVRVIKASNLHLRLEERESKDEISDLTVTFNNMLNRLETTFELQNNFVSNASHELKTPLTIISGEAELALRQEDLQPGSRSAFEKIINESERLEQLMNSLISLAQTGFDGKKLPLEKLRVDELILAVKRSANKIFPNNQIEIDYDHLPDDDNKLFINGNPATLRVALLNVFINACKYSDNQKVKVDISTDEKNIVITVQDFGIGI
ncbi:MAG TPA: HAMP domain-containing sensor histidine kinase, partial [Bacteroidia bacterium]